MEPNELKDRLSSGVIAFPVTPFRRDLSLDLDGLRQNLEKLLEFPIRALIAAGGTGELYSLTPEEHREVVRVAIETARKRVPVLAGVGFNAPLACRLAEQAARDGAAGILAFPPYYPQASDAGMLAYYRAISEATPLGMIIYSRDWAVFSPEAVEKLAALPRLVAWKDGQADMRRYQMIIGRVGRRLQWIGGAGDDAVPAYYSIGIRTYTSSIANVAPKLSLLLHDCAAGGQSDRLQQLMSRYVIPLYSFRTRQKGYEVSVMKRMMEFVGLAGGPVRPPLVDVLPGDFEELKALAREWQDVIQ